MKTHTLLAVLAIVCVHAQVGEWPPPPNYVDLYGQCGGTSGPAPNGTVPVNGCWANTKVRALDAADKTYPHLLLFHSVPRASAFAVLPMGAFISVSQMGLTITGAGLRTRTHAWSRMPTLITTPRPPKAAAASFWQAQRPQCPRCPRLRTSSRGMAAAAGLDHRRPLSSCPAMAVGVRPSARKSLTVATQSSASRKRSTGRFTSAWWLDRPTTLAFPHMWMHAAPLDNTIDDC